MSGVALRTALIWHDEVMSDVVVEKPTKITLGATGKATFVVPDVGLPESFAIVRPGKRGYLLTLGAGMRGTICIDGEQREVAEFVRDEGDGEFRATSISGRDWGVIELDASGETKLFFQFVPLEVEPQFLTPKVVFAGFAGFVLSSLILTVMWSWIGHPLDEAVLGGVGMAGGTLIGALFLWLAVRAFVDDNDQKASLVFSIVAHGALLFSTYSFYDGSDPFVWPGPRDLAGSYLITRLETPELVEPPKAAPTVGQVNKQEAAAASPTPKNLQTATKGDEGAHGGKGDTERARDPNARDVPPEPPKVAFFEDKNRKVLDNILDRNLSTNLGKFTGIKGDTLTKGSLGYGTGTGTGVGDGIDGTGTTRGSKGRGAGGGGNVEGDFVTNKGKIDTGKERPGGTCVGPNCKGAGPREVKVAVGEMAGDPGGLTAEEINRVVKARAGVFRACYQKELNRTPGLGGKLVVKFKIDGQGVVQAASMAGGSSLSNDAVVGCVTSNVMRLRFPAKGGTANVTYPFVFSQGG